MTAGDPKRARPERGDCPAAKKRAGCGHLWAGTRCQRLRGKQDTAQLKHDG